MSDDKQPVVFLYQASDSAAGVALTLGKYAILDGFEDRAQAFDWLLAHLDNNLISNTRLGFERVERAAVLEQTLQLQRAALLEVDPNGKEN